MCLYPQLIKNKKYTSNMKNGGVIPAVNDPRTLYVSIGCGNCLECRKAKAREWQVRIMEDVKHNTNGKFVTLTFSNESIKQLWKDDQLTDLKGYELDNGIAKRAVRLFLERWRKKNKKSLRHWFVTELGGNGTENIHLHGIVWGVKSRKELEETWGYGYIWPRYDKDWYNNYVGVRTANYITKYITKIDEKHKGYKSKILTSPGIGRDYINTHNANKNKYIQNDTNETYKTSTGHKIGLPIYYRNKIYSDDEREKLWLEKLDKGERYICGNKVNADDHEAILKLLEYHRERNIELGYGDNKINWDVNTYEKNLREIMLLKRLKIQ